MLDSEGSRAIIAGTCNPGEGKVRPSDSWLMTGNSRPMHKVLMSSALLAILAAAPGLCADEIGSAFVGQDLHLSAATVTSSSAAEQRRFIVLEGDAEVTFGSCSLSADKAVVRLDVVRSEYKGTEYSTYTTSVYLRDNISIQRDNAVKTSHVSMAYVAGQDAAVARFEVTGRVFATAQTARDRDPRDMDICKEAITAIDGHSSKSPSAAFGPETVREAPRSGKGSALLESLLGDAPAEEESETPRFRYPVHISGVGGTQPQIEFAKDPNGNRVATVIGRFYIWQKLDDKGTLVELEADSAVMFFSSSASGSEVMPADIRVISGRSDIEAIYLGGDIKVTEGLRTINCDEMFYDFSQRRAVAINAEMRTFDPKRGIPIYLRAQRIRQVAENRFSASDITLTTSEFHDPQFSLTASKVIVTDTASIDAEAERLGKDSYQAQIAGVRARYYGLPFFAWPKMFVDMERPDVPIRTAHFSYDNTWGASLETRWYLSRLLGLREPEGSDNTFMLDYFGKRGFGTGVDINYQTREYFGRLLGYIVDDHGTDDLGSRSSRQDLEPDKQTRGRLMFQHRHYLDDGWQLTTELSYLSDRHFLESYYRGEFDNGKEQETLIYAKKLRDNWAFSLLGKWRINDFQDQVEEMPTAEFHLTGQSLMDGTFTLYSDSQVGSLRQKSDKDSVLGLPDEKFALGVTRSELDMPLSAGEWRIVPFVAGTGGYDDRSGFYSPYATGNALGRPERNTLGMGEAGVRAAAEYWKLYRDARSRLWDLDGLRHIIRPELSATTYQETDDVWDQRDIVRLGLNQTLQTKRGPAESRRTVDWMNLNVEMVIVDDAAAVAGAPDRYIWNDPAVPFRSIAAPQVFNGDLGPALTTFEDYGPTRTHLAGDYRWRITDTTALLSDGYYDTCDGQLQQYNLGFTHVRYPDLSYYLGTRYLRNVDVLDEKGTNSLVFAVTYVLDPRYTMVFAQQYDFDYDMSVSNEVTILRRYHRAYCGLTFSVDESLDRRSVIFSIWPQGVKELAIGSRRYMSLSSVPGNQ